MGEHNIQQADGQGLREFTQKLLADLRALERMLADGSLESGVTRIGAEQEVFLVDEEWRPATTALDVLERVDDPRFTTELGKFNLEFNLDPIDLGGKCLSEMETQLDELFQIVRRAAAEVGSKVVVTGILPTLVKEDLDLDHMTPLPRYFALNQAMTEMRGRQYDFHIRGRDQLLLQHDNVMLEACNTSFQVHFQVSPENFVQRYNAAQAVAGPVLAAAVNSPLLFGKHLWRETRIALFQQAVDTRGPDTNLRSTTPRVAFGSKWVDESALEIFQEDIARFRVIMATDIDEDPLRSLEEGRVPELRALRLHNGTVWRWNRPCYGISEGRPHLRIENRILPSGPTPVDEIANAAFWFGLMRGIDEMYPDITRVMAFEQAQENFVKAARHGLAAQFAWPGHRNVPAQQLILEELLPLSHRGLRELGIVEEDIDRYLGVIEARTIALRTGARWLVESYNGMPETTARSKSLAALVAGLIDRQTSGEPVHTWTLATADEAGDKKHHYARVEQFMTTDLYTVNGHEPVDMAAYVMNWKHIRHVPVEDGDHRLIGLVSHRTLVRLACEYLSGSRIVPAVCEIMETNVITTHPHTSTLEAIQLMRQHRISTLPVVDDDNRLVGIVSERDFMDVAARLLEQFLSE